MPARMITYNKLAAKGTPVSARVLSNALWQKLIESNRDVPRNFSQLRLLGYRIFNVHPKPSPKAPPAPEFAKVVHNYDLDDPCGTGLLDSFVQALANPAITPAQHKQLDEELAAAVPKLPNKMSTTHFDLHWTETDPDPKNNISRALVEATSRDLETAWSAYNAAFGRAPYVAKNQTKIQIQFYLLADGTSGVTSPEGPIDFNSEKFTANPGLCKPISAHELFHREQYSFGLSVKYRPPDPKAWFIEGTANWGSVFVWQTVAQTRAIEPLFTDPNQSLFEASYKATPFWIFIQGMQSDKYSNAIVELFKQFEDLTGSIMGAVETVLELAWNSAQPYSRFDFNFMLFNWARINDLWRQKRNGYLSLGPLYPVIKTSDGATITPKLTISTHNLSKDQSFSTAASVEEYGTQYYQVNLGNNTSGVGLYEETKTDGVKYLYTNSWLLNGQVQLSDVSDISRLVQGNLGTMYSITLSYANQFVFTVSADQLGPNNYQIYLSPTNSPKPPWR